MRDVTHELGWMDEWAQNMPSWNYAKNVEYVFGRWPKSVRRNQSMDLSDRVRMWMLLNMIAQKTGNLSKM